MRKLTSATIKYGSTKNGLNKEHTVTKGNIHTHIHIHITATELSHFIIKAREKSYHFCFFLKSRGGIQYYLSFGRTT